jgi:hypothetical protein
MWEWVEKNKEWIFSGAGLTGLALLGLFGRKVLGRFSRETPQVRVGVAVVAGPFTGPVEFVTITVQNRTKEVLRLGNIFVELSTREPFMPTLDPLTGGGQERREIQPGDSFIFHIPVAHILETGLSVEAFRCAAVRDAVDRVYRSSSRELRKVLQAVYLRHRMVASR